MDVRALLSRTDVILRFRSSGIVVPLSDSLGRCSRPGGRYGSCRKTGPSCKISVGVRKSLLPSLSGEVNGLFGGYLFAFEELVHPWSENRFSLGVPLFATWKMVEILPLDKAANRL